MNTESILAMFGLPGGVEWVVILLGALLIFGRRLPDVARSIGRSIVEFKKGVRDIRDEVDLESQLPPPSRVEGQTPAAVTQQTTKEPTNAGNTTNTPDTTPVAPSPTTEADAAVTASSSQESHATPVTPASPTPQSNDS